MVDVLYYINDDHYNNINNKNILLHIYKNNIVNWWFHSLSDIIYKSGYTGGNIGAETLPLIKFLLLNHSCFQTFFIILYYYLIFHFLGK